MRQLTDVLNLRATAKWAVLWAVLGVAVGVAAGLGAILFQYLQPVNVEGDRQTNAAATRSASSGLLASKGHAELGPPPAGAAIKKRTAKKGCSAPAADMQAATIARTPATFRRRSSWAEPAGPM